MKKINVIIVDDHKLFREGIDLIFKNIDFIDTTIQASDGIELLEILKSFKAEIILMDINMPKMDGITATKKVKEKYPNIKIIALSVYSDPEYYIRMTNAGVDGFLLKDTDSAELEKAINSVLDNKEYFSQELLQKVISCSPEKKNVKTELTKREIEIINLMSKGFSNEEIGNKLFISKRTAERHRFNIQSKINCKNSIEIVMYAIKNELIEV